MYTDSSHFVVSMFECSEIVGSYNTQDTAARDRSKLGQEISSLMYICLAFVLSEAHRTLTL